MTRHIPEHTELVATVVDGEVLVVDGEVEVFPIAYDPEDELLHTAENGYCCGTPGCPCMTTV